MLDQKQTIAFLDKSDRYFNSIKIKET